MPGKRHSKPDQEHGDQAVSHLLSAGFTLPADNSASKAQRLLAVAKKAVPAGFDPGQYAIGEAWDAATAASIIPQLAQLLSSEMYQQDADGVAVIQKLIVGLSKFIASESADMSDALAADATEDAVTPDIPGAMAIRNPLKFISETDDELRVGNYIILYGGRDLSAFGHIGNTKPLYKNSDGTHGDRFSPKVKVDSDYTAMGRFPVDWEHGLYADEGEPGKDDLFGYVDWSTKNVDEKGMFVERVLNRRKKYMQWVETLIKANLIGTSSECVDGQAKALNDGTITVWPLKRDTLTVAPAEYRMMGENVVTALKALKLLPADKPGQAGPDGPTAAEQPADIHKEFEMDEIEAKALRDTTAANTKAIADLTAQNAELLIELRKPALKTVPGQVEPAPEDRKPFKTLGEQLFSEVKRAHGGGIDPRQERLNQKYIAEMKALGMNESTLADGGAAVQTEFSSVLLQRAYTVGPVIPATTQQEIGPGFNAYSALMVNETSRADGSRSGAIAMYWQAEAGSYTSSQIKLRRFNLQLEKITGLIYATDENLGDATQLESLVNREFPKEFDFKVTDSILNGSGAGQPLGVVGGPSTISIAKETNQAAATVVIQNLNKMWARLYAPCRANAVWYINQDVEPALDLLYIPAGTAGLEPRMITYGPDNIMRIKNRPVVLLEQCQTLGTVGDIILMDPSQYMTIKKGGLDLATSIHVAFTTGEQAFRFTGRTNGAPMWNSALTPKNGTNTLAPYLTLATR